MLLRRIDWPAFDWRSSFEEFDRLRRQMDLFGSDFPGRIVRGATAGVFPLMNMTEDQENFYVRAELPGIAGDDLDISVAGDTLSISGERVMPAENENAKYHRREREAGKFSRIINLPSRIDTDKVKANSQNGILTVTLPKAEEAKPKQITVKKS
ncbi:MAG: Hsp20/alpha crystallin family protein [Deltaproteobacteria bacterium]|nr:Hsp20/alpha crystallin family protein [Deltaproteobacteria bacterium]